MKKNLLILLFIFLIISSCNCNLFNNDDLGNTPLDIPDYVLYGMLHTNGVDYITVIDMEKDSIVGYYRVTKEGEYIGDFCLGSDNLLYITISPLEKISSEIRIFDPKEGKIVGKIIDEYSPEIIFPLPNDEAFVFHYFVQAGDSATTNSILDLKNKIVIKKIISNLGGPGYKEIFCSPSNDYWIFSNFPVSDDTYIIEFLAGPDTLGERILFKKDYNGSNIDPTLTKFVSDTKIYARCDEIFGVVVYEFPSGEPKNIIPLEIKPVDILALPNGRVYVAQYDYYGLETTDNYITVIDAESDAVIKRINVCPGPDYLAYSEAMNKLYMGSLYENSIAVVDPNTDSLIKLIKGDSLGSDLNQYFRLIPNK
jgi:hypothetical protein